MEEKTNFEKGKDQKKDYIEPLKSGKEFFSLSGKSIGCKVRDYWRFMYSNLYDIQGDVAEFLVAKALKKELPENRNGWTPYDMTYRGKRFEVKSTAYFQLWKESEEISEVRNFSIQKTHIKNQNTKTRKERQNDIYVFCINNGRNYKDANPLNLDNWTFYVVPTSTINIKCSNNMKISLGRVKELANEGDGIKYDKLKEAIDKAIDEMNGRFTGIAGSAITKKEETR